MPRTQEPPAPVDAVPMPPAPGPAPRPTGPRNLAQLVRDHQAAVWRYLRYLGADAGEADDLTQETFLAVSRSRFQQRCPRQTAGYLRTAARNQLLMLRRRQNRQVNTVDLEAADEAWAAATGDESPGGWENHLETLRRCLETLTDRARHAVTLQYHDNESRGAIAHQLGMKPDGVKTLLRRARQSLRECIERKQNNS